MNFSESYIDELCGKYNNSPGICVGIIQDGVLAFCKGYGTANLEYDIPITGDSVFHCASMAKQFTAACTALLTEEGKIAVQDPIRLYFPELPDCMDEVNISHLVYMTNGIYDMYSTANTIYGIRENDFITEDEAWNFIKSSGWLMFPPGEKWSYGNTGYFLLAQLVKRVIGITISEYADKNIFKPLKMNSTFLRDDRSKIIKNRAIGYSRYDHVHYNDQTEKYTAKGENFSVNEDMVDIPGAGQLWTTVCDLQKWDNNFYRNTLGNGSQPLIDIITASGRLNNGKLCGYGYGLFIFEKDGYKHISHGGWAGGYSSYVDRIMEKNLSVVILGNHTDIFQYIDVYKESNGITDKIVRRILDIEPSKTEFSVNRDRKPDKKVQCGVDIMGKYQCGSNSFIWEIKRLNDDFSIRQNFGHEFTVYYSGNNTFISDNNIMFSFNPKDKSIIVTAGSEKFIYTPFIENEIDLSEYAGSYHNEALNLTFCVSILPEKLSVTNQNRHNTAIDLEYSPTVKDSFIAHSTYIRYYCISFQRNENNDIISFVYRDDEPTGRENFIFKKILTSH